ncbi:MAG: hypothetical protein P4L73_05690 [Caulobacteraceae bacterium]|nr:hypothetical protein [Caulobacteraceae bacterium]
MQVLKAVAGVPNLKDMVATWPSARLLNLHGLAAERPTDPDYFIRPMFVHPVLNRSIIVKHNVRPGEEERQAPRRFNATKVIFPFDPRDLNLGGQFLFVDQLDFEPALTRHLEYGDLPLHRDVAVLRILDRLPTLDPFLVREALVSHRFNVDSGYYRFSEPEKAHMLGFVEHEIESLIELCFGEVQAHDRRAKRLSQLLLADHDSPELEPLRVTLRMDGPEFMSAMFAWKAFLYYRWRAHALTPSLKATVKSIGRINKRRYDTDALRFVVSARALLETTIAKSWREIGAKLQLYDDAYDALTYDQKPENFRQFLMSGSNLFIDLGNRIGVLEQVVSFWDHRLQKHHTGSMSPDEVMDAMRDLLQGLSIWPSAFPAPDIKLTEFDIRHPPGRRSAAAA